MPSRARYGLLRVQQCRASRAQLHLGDGGNALVADIDYHHGNGTQALVGGGLSYISTHASPAYPGTGDSRDNHVGSDGALVNVPLPVSGIATEAFVAIWTRTLRALAQRVRPGLLVVSAGYDLWPAIRSATSGLPNRQRANRPLACEIAAEYCAGRALFVLEGGYDPATLATCVIETILGFEEGRVVERADFAAVPGRQQAIVGDLEGSLA